MKKILIITIISLSITIISCKSGLEKNYNELSKIEDLKEVAKEIPAEKLDLLKHYIEESNYSDLANNTYSSLLFNAEDKEREELYEKERKEKEQIAAEELKRETADKIVFLCAHKWKIKEYSAILRADDTPENIELAKLILNKAVMLKDSKILISVERNGNKAYVKGLFDDKMTKVFNGFGKRWKKYHNDGTFEEFVGGETSKGTWSFINATAIRESRPSINFLERKKGDSSFILEIKTLDDTTFHFFEEKQDPFITNNNNNLRYEIIMK